MNLLCYRVVKRLGARGATALLALALWSAADTTGLRAQTATRGLDGTWRVVAAERDGRAADELKQNYLTLSGHDFLIHREHETVHAGTFATDPARKPAQIDFRHTTGQASGQTWLGIYRLEGDTLKIADNAPDPSVPRPRRFATARDSGHVLLTFKRHVR